MRRKHLLLSVMICICVICVSVAIAYAAVADDIKVANNPTLDAMYIAGQYSREGLRKDTISTNNNSDIVAQYHGHTITSAVLDYHRNMNGLLVDVGSANYETDIEIINRIIRGIMQLEEAERLGIDATEDEIDAYMQTVERAYSLSDGKELINSYCDGAGITLEEFYQMQRAQIPETITRQKLKNEISRQYCTENGIEFDSSTPTSEDMLAAQEAYIAALFEQNKDDIIYYIDDAVTS